MEFAKNVYLQNNFGIKGRRKVAELIKTKICGYKRS
jgi:hypothetical protein